MKQTLYEKHLRAMNKLYFADNPIEYRSAATACETITKETAEGVLDWILKEGWMPSRNRIFWANEKFDYMKTTSELFSLYLSNAGETKQELNEKG